LTLAVWEAPANIGTDKFSLCVI